MALNPVEGLQLYVVAPLAVKLVEFPAQIVALATVMVGFDITVTVEVAVAEQLPLVPLMVYICVEAGLAFTVEPVLAFKEAAGLQV